MDLCATIFTTFLTIVLSIKIFFKLSNKYCESQKRLDGKTCVVTGGTTGMGLEIAKEIAKRGAKVIIACPFEKEGTDALEMIVKHSNNVKVIFKQLNLASLKSTREFANDILKSEERLDILINNAGMGASRRITADGMNNTMQTNYYGHFLLTNLLLPLLKKTGSPNDKSRIVNTTSLYHYGGSFEPYNMNKLSHWTLFQLYANSKLCLLLFSTYLAERLKGHNVVINSIDPGAVGTAIFKKNLGNFVGTLVAVVLYFLVKSPREGAQTAMHVTLDQEVGDVNGEYFRNCEIRKAKPVAYDKEVAKTLWDESVRLVKIKDSELDL